ncbi:hypothetical protein PENTCL1PPCAC_27331 [Pristionchus entomophagus]|uniref:Uncharacterized protein n=1 Tax=Pristionchus entomophagus TaxID=358040 RepID=A0AAV5UFY2_9BILA|nr:hypothetical protein PENTCL1PPCAC_27331 [Pristionchus entomophagus]
MRQAILLLLLICVVRVGSRGGRGGGGRGGGISGGNGEYRGSSGGGSGYWGRGGWRYTGGGHHYSGSRSVYGHVYGYHYHHSPVYMYGGRQLIISPMHGWTGYTDPTWATQFIFGSMAIRIPTTRVSVTYRRTLQRRMFISKDNIAALALSISHVLSQFGSIIREVFTDIPSIFNTRSHGPIRDSLIFLISQSISFKVHSTDL